MLCLWLTLADPDPPDNGQFIYTRGLIRAAAAAGATVQVVGLERPDGRHRNGEVGEGVRWWLAEHRPRSKNEALLSRLPLVAMRNNTPAMRHAVDVLLRRDRFDAIVFDSIAAGWALPRILARYRRRARPPVVYLSHNHEAGIARQIAAAEVRTLRRQLKSLEAVKAANLERGLIASADLVTSNSPDDRARFQAEWPGKRVDFLPPGYDGTKVGRRSISPETPRRAVIIGTFDWLPKRTSLASFLAAADPLFARANIELQVVGAADEAFLAKLRTATAAARFTGRVPDIAPYMADARLAVVPDDLGGFKLKTLDYVFARLPIFGIEGAVPGLPLRRGESISLHPDHAALAQGIVAAIDDFALLNSMQERAYAACSDQFDWARIGQDLLAAISQVAGGRGAAVVPHVIASTA